MSFGDAGDKEPGELETAHSFVELMALDRLESIQVLYSKGDEPEEIERYRSKAIPFNPGEGSRAFGGHVYAQSAYAASQTVGKGFVVHVSFFLREANSPPCIIVN